MTPYLWFPQRARFFQEKKKATDRSRLEVPHLTRRSKDPGPVRLDDTPGSGFEILGLGDAAPLGIFGILGIWLKTFGV